MLNLMRLTDGVPVVFFFFSSRRRHTRCLSDWSSDVCSSDLQLTQLLGRLPWFAALFLRAFFFRDFLAMGSSWANVANQPAYPIQPRILLPWLDTDRARRRSEERRVGKECRSRGQAYSLKDR